MFHTSDRAQRGSCYVSLMANMLENKADFIKVDSVMPVVLMAHLQEDWCRSQSGTVIPGHQLAMPGRYDETSHGQRAWSTLTVLTPVQRLSDSTEVQVINLIGDKTQIYRQKYWNEIHKSNRNTLGMWRSSNLNSTRKDYRISTLHYNMRHRPSARRLYQFGRFTFDNVRNYVLSALLLNANSWKNPCSTTDFTCTASQEAFDECKFCYCYTSYTMRTDYF